MTREHRLTVDRYTDPRWHDAEARTLWPRQWVALGHHREVGSRGLERAGYVAHRDGGDLRVTWRGEPAVTRVAVGGLVWACASPVRPLEEHLAPVWPHLAPYGIDDWTLDDAIACPLGCNWKLSVDAHDEGYHVGTLHPEAAGIVDDEGETLERFGLHSRIVVPMGRPRRRRPSLHPHVRALLLEADVDPEPWEADPEGARRALQRARRRPEHQGLSDDQLTDNHQWHIFPNLQLNVYADHALLFSHWPVGPQRCRFEQRVLTRHGGSATGLDVVSPSHPRFGPVTGADLRLLPELQRSYASGQLDVVTLGPRERALGWFHEAIEAHVAPSP